MSNMEPLHVISPLIESSPLSNITGCKVLLKMDSVQPSGSFKIRGIGNICTNAVICRSVKHLVASSGGNAGLSVAYAGRKLGVPTTIVVPSSTPQYMQRRIALEGAKVIQHGDVWAEAHAYAQKLVIEKENAELIHPFNHPEIWNGHASIVKELYNQLRGEKPSYIISVVGGGGLLCGLCEGLERVGWMDVPVLACETKGASSFAQSAKVNELVTLRSIDTIAKTLAKVSEQTLICYAKNTIYPCVVSDKEALDALIAFQEHHQTLVEPSCSSGLALLYSSERMPVILKETDVIVVIVCGGNMVNIAQIEEWKKMVVE